MVAVPWGSIAPFLYSRIWNFSTVLAKKKFQGGNFLNFHTVQQLEILAILEENCWSVLEQALSIQCDHLNKALHALIKAEHNFSGKASS